MSFSTLCFDSVGLDYDVEGINPHFMCPFCKQRFEPKYKPIQILPATFDVNAKTSFTCPNCGAKIALFVALHKDANGLSLCIQKSSEEGAGGIRSNWWSLTGGT